jgi:hypothetical protein
MPIIIAYHPMGFEVRFEVELADITQMVHKLEQRHYRPSRELVFTPEGLPICPRHGVPMQKREKQGDTWYSHKVTDPKSGEVLYCRGYASASSPGFVIPPTPVDRVHDSGYAYGRQESDAVDAHSHDHQDNHASTESVDLDALNDALFG